MTPPPDFELWSVDTVREGGGDDWVRDVVATAGRQLETATAERVLT